MPNRDNSEKARNNYFRCACFCGCVKSTNSGICFACRRGKHKKQRKPSGGYLK